jgi:hypothetical protein
VILTILLIYSTSCMRSRDMILRNRDTPVILLK